MTTLTTPHPKTTRDTNIADRTLAGEPRVSIAKDYGITAERVRQIANRELTARGITTPAPKPTPAPKTPTPAEHAHALTTITTIAANNPHYPLTTIATTAGHGVTTTDVTNALGPVETLRRQANLRRELGAKYTRDACISALRSVAAHLDPETHLTIETYTTHALPDAPSASTILARFNASWVTACTAAGITPGMPPRKTYERRFTDQDMLQAAVDFFRDNGAQATMPAYMDWAAKSPNRPAASTLRKHFGSWGKTRLAAAAQLGQTWE